MPYGRTNGSLTEAEMREFYFGITPDGRRHVDMAAGIDCGEYVNLASATADNARRDPGDWFRAPPRMRPPGCTCGGEGDTNANRRACPYCGPDFEHADNDVTALASSQVAPQAKSVIALPAPGGAHAD